MDVDFSLDAMYPAAAPTAPPADPWLARRLLSFGASEALALLLALGLEQPDGETPKYILDAAARLFAVKAGARKAKAAGRAAQLGSDAERPLVAAWNEAPPHGWPAITHADAMPRELLPLLDRHQPRLSWSPDGWCRVAGALVPVEIKTDQRGDRRGPARHWVWQVQQAMAVAGADSALVVYGGGWASWDERMRRGLVPWVVERDDEMIRRLREAAVVGWQRVEELRRGREGGV
jgi:hypothetical protein